MCLWWAGGGGELKDTRKRKNRIFLGFDKNAFVLEEKKSYRVEILFSSRDINAESIRKYKTDDR